jgi:hypothetical protein
MGFKRLNDFTYFSLEDFLVGKRLVFVKAALWNEEEGKDMVLAGSRVVVQIVEDKTKYSKEDVDNFGEQLTVKVRGVAPSAYQKLKPLITEVVITDVEKARVWGDFRNELSIIAKVAIVKEAN